MTNSFQHILFPERIVIHGKELYVFLHDTHLSESRIHATAEWALFKC